MVMGTAVTWTASVLVQAGVAGLVTSVQPRHGHIGQQLSARPRHGDTDTGPSLPGRGLYTRQQTDSAPTIL